MTTNILLIANIFILLFGIYYIVYKNKVTKDRFIQTLIDNVNLENSICKCLPNSEVLENGDIMIIHNSFDKREVIERLFENET